MKPLSFNEPPATDAPVDDRPRRSGRRWPWFAVALLLLAAIVWIALRWFEGKDKTPPPPPPVQVTLATVEQKDFPVYIAGVGNVMPNQSVTVKARVDGQLQTLGYTEGQDVKQGQLIAQIDPRPFQAQLAQAQATRGKDAATLANARLDLGRYQDLIKEDATSQQQLDTQKALVAQLEAAVKTDDAQIAYAKTQLDYTTITAPISGRTGLRLVDVGNIVHAADTNGLVVIDQIDPISVVFTLPDAAFQQVNAAMRSSQAPLEALAYSRDDNAKPLAKGRLVLVDNHIDTTSGTVQIKATFPNANHALWPGQYVNVRLYVQTRPRRDRHPGRRRAAQPEGHVRVHRRRRPEGADAADRGRADPGRRRGRRSRPVGGSAGRRRRRVQGQAGRRIDDGAGRRVVVGSDRHAGRQRQRVERGRGLRQSGRAERAREQQQHDEVRPR